MFDNFTHWTWVWIAWAQVVLSYAGYLWYMSALKRKSRD